MAFNVGLIGGGWPGMAQAEALANQPGVKVTALSDKVPARLAGLRKRFPEAAVYRDDLHLIAEAKVEAVSLCTPTHVHGPAVEAAIKRRLHVLCEGPLAGSAIEAQRLNRIAEKRGVVLRVAMQRRFGAGESAARQVIQRGLIGTPLRVVARWTRPKAIPLGTGWYGQKALSGGGALMDLGLPLLDAAWWVLGRPAAQSVFAQTRRDFPALVPPTVTYDAEDFAEAMVNLEGGGSLQLTCSWAARQPADEGKAVLTVYGSDGAIELYGSEGPVLYREGKAEAGERLKMPKVLGYDAVWRAFAKDVRAAAGKQAAVVAGIADETGEATDAGADRQLADGADGVAMLRLVEAMYRSAEANKVVKVG